MGFRRFSGKFISLLGLAASDHTVPYRVGRALSLPGRRNLICSPKKERAFLLLRSRGISSSRALWSALPVANSTKAASWSGSNSSDPWASTSGLCFKTNSQRTLNCSDGVRLVFINKTGGRLADGQQIWPFDFKGASLLLLESLGFFAQGDQPLV